jgi:hypothetical protein
MKAIIHILPDGSKKLVKIEGATSMEQCSSLAGQITKDWKIESEEARPEDVIQEQQSNVDAQA